MSPKILKAENTRNIELIACQLSYACCIAKATTLVYKNKSRLLCFLSLPKVYGWVDYEGSKTAEMHTQRPRYESSMNPFFFLIIRGEIIPGYITSRTTTNILMVTPPDCHLHVAHGHASILHATNAIPSFHSSSLPPTKWTWSCFFLTCYQCNLRGISAENPCVLFTFGNRCKFCYFHSSTVRLPPLQRQILKGSSNQYTTRTLRFKT